MSCKLCAEILSYTPLFFMLFSFAICALLCTNEPPEATPSNEKIEKSDEDFEETSPSRTNIRLSEASAEECTSFGAQTKSSENQLLSKALTDRDKILVNYHKTDLLLCAFHVPVFASFGFYEFTDAVGHKQSMRNE
ncbi:unnamed protein product [Cylicostephanus goldi]|uniref:Uncharacterized protein n=1 Tax=Cylicostephanus goldi TaxID=71465 RepID=A0A3P7MEM3_CYLGO|nr:unnamed protein product [Cylicostephanus goldi]